MLSSCLISFRWASDTSSQIPEMPPEVLGDEEHKQLVTYEKGMVQGCYNRHPGLRRDILVTVCLLLGLKPLDIHHQYCRRGSTRI
jgi:hypothetical protein